MDGDGVGQPVGRQLAFIVLGVALILALPLLAMQFTDEVAWSPFDFVVAGALLLLASVVFAVSMSMVNKVHYRIALGLAIAAVLMLVWAELAVGIFGTPFAGT